MFYGSVLLFNAALMYLAARLRWERRKRVKGDPVAPELDFPHVFVGLELRMEIHEVLGF